MTYIELSSWQLSIAASLIVISAGISAWLRLGLERQLLLAAVRTVVQLLLVGFVLVWVFAPGRAWYVVFALMSTMTIIAGFSAARRTDRRYAGMTLDAVVSLWITSWLMTAFALFAVVQVQNAADHASQKIPWYSPQYAIPLLGMILGNTISAISLSLDRLTSELSNKRAEVETLLALGATRWEAARGALQQAVRTGMIPTINAMMVVGLVSLPGMMTGQLIAGQNPEQATRYQSMIMFLLAAGTALGTFGVVLLGYRRLFSADHQFLPERVWALGR
jgi:putative ABC transport system permease protein